MSGGLTEDGGMSSELEHVPELSCSSVFSNPAVQGDDLES